MADLLTDATLARIREGWAEELDVPLGAFTSPGATTFARDDTDAVVVVDLADSQVTVAPPAAVDLIEQLPPPARTGLDDVIEALAPFDPVPVGAATLSYVDRVIIPTGVEVAVGPVQNVDLLRERCTVEEWEESGLIDMPARIAARRPDGKVAAVAGYERWGRHLAQLGVLTDPDFRGQGYAAAAAARAAQVAQNEPLVPQWRSRVGNSASMEVAQRLGFAQLGHQLAVLLPGAVQSSTGQFSG